MNPIEKWADWRKRLEAYEKDYLPELMAVECYDDLVLKQQRIEKLEAVLDAADELRHEWTELVSNSAELSVTYPQWVKVKLDAALDAALEDE